MRRIFLEKYLIYRPLIFFYSLVECFYSDMFKIQIYLNVLWIFMSQPLSFWHFLFNKIGLLNISDILPSASFILIEMKYE